MNINKTNPNSLGAKPKIQRFCMTAGLHSKMPLPPTFHLNHNSNHNSNMQCNNVVSAKSSKNNINQQKSSWDTILTKTTFKSTPPISPSIISSQFSAKSYNTDIINFNQFDPIRTLQFLTWELKTKLKTQLPDDKNIHKILSEIQHTLKRLPRPPIAGESSIYNIQNILKSNGDLNKINKNDDEIPERDKSTNYKNQFCQTIENGSIDFIASSQTSISLKKMYDHNENLNNVMRNDLTLNQKLQQELVNCRDEVFLLKNEIKFLKEKLNEETISEKSSINSLESRYKRLEGEMRSLQEIIRLKQIDEKLNFAKENKQNDELISKTENDKIELTILLKSREKQIQNLKKELNGIQHFIREQTDLMYDDKIYNKIKKTKSNLSAASSASSSSSSPLSSSYRKHQNGNGIHNETKQKQQKQVNLHNQKYQHQQNTQIKKSTKNDSENLKKNTENFDDEFHKSKNFNNNNITNIIIDENNEKFFEKCKLKNSILEFNEIGKKFDELKAIIDDVRLPSPPREFLHKLPMDDISCNFDEQQQC